MRPYSARGTRDSPSTSSSSSSSRSLTPAQYQLVKSSENQLVESLMEDINSRGAFCGSEKVLMAAERLVGVYNSVAMQLVDKGTYEGAYQILQKADELTRPSSGGDEEELYKETRLRLRAVTLNNMGCYLKRRGKLHSALKQLEKAAGIEKKVSKADNPAGTHLNICATLSQLGRHNDALEHSKQALLLLLHEGQDETLGDDDSTARLGARVREVGILAKAYHNLAVEHEYLGQATEALIAYTRAEEVAQRVWGKAHPVTNAMKNARVDFERTLKHRRLSSRGGSDSRHFRPWSAPVRRR